MRTSLLLSVILCSVVNAAKCQRTAADPYTVDPSIQVQVDSATSGEGSATVGYMYLQMSENDSVVLYTFNVKDPLAFTGAWCNSDSIRIMSIKGLGTSAAFLYTQVGTNATLTYHMGDERKWTYRLLPTDTTGKASLDVAVESYSMVLTEPIVQTEGHIVSGFVDLRTVEFYSLDKDNELMRHRVRLKAYFRVPLKTGTRNRF